MVGVWYGFAVLVPSLANKDTCEGGSTQGPLHTTGGVVGSPDLAPEVGEGVISGDAPSQRTSEFGRGGAGLGSRFGSKFPRMGLGCLVGGLSATGPWVCGRLGWA